MLQVNTKVKLIKPENDPDLPLDIPWPTDLDCLVGETCYVLRYVGEHHGHALYHVQAESDRWGLVKSFGALECWLSPFVDGKNYDATCPLCGSPGEMGFNLVHCSNSQCQNGTGYGMEKRDERPTTDEQNPCVEF